jgi:hypothetical protein
VLTGAERVFKSISRDIVLESPVFMGPTRHCACFPFKFERRRHSEVSGRRPPRQASSGPAFSGRPQLSFHCRNGAVASLPAGAAAASVISAEQHGDRRRTAYSRHFPAPGARRHGSLAVAFELLRRIQIESLDTIVTFRITREVKATWLISPGTQQTIRHPLAGPT